MQSSQVILIIMAVSAVIIGVALCRWVLGIYLLRAELAKINANIERLIQVVKGE